MADQEDSNAPRRELPPALQALVKGVPGLTEKLAASAPGGSINVSIDTGSTTYTLAVSIPLTSGSPYTFTLTSQTDVSSATPADTIASFSFTDETHYSVAVNMPTITSGKTRITAGFALTQGS